MANLGDEFNEYRRKLAQNLEAEQTIREKKLSGEMKPKVKTVYKTKIKRIKTRPKMKRRKSTVKSRERMIRGLGKVFSPRMKMFERNRKLTPLQIQQLRRLKQLRRINNPELNTNRNAVLRKFHQDKFNSLRKQQINETQISAHTRMQLETIARIQNKAKLQDAKMQRIKRERALLGDSMSLLNTPNIFKTHQLDFTGVSNDNILKSPNLFRENPEDFVLRKRGRSILDTQENTLKF